MSRIDGGGKGTEGVSHSGSGETGISGGKRVENAMTSETGKTGKREVAAETTATSEDGMAAKPESGNGELTISKAQNAIEGFHAQSISRIMGANGKYLSEGDKTRITQGVDRLQAVKYNANSGRTGGYRFLDGKSSITISAQNMTQLERSTIHETNHFTSKNMEIIVPHPDKNGYTVYNTVGTRQSSWFHSNETGQNSGYQERGRGLNEGLTTLYTNRELATISLGKAQEAERQQIYSHVTELTEQLEKAVGADTLKSAYYGGDLQALENKVNDLAGEKSFDFLRESLDRTLSKDHAVQVQAMKDAQSILDKIHEEVKKRD